MDQDMSFGTKFVNIFVSPGETFKSLENKPDWLIPVIFITVSAIALVVLTWPYLIEIQIEKTMAMMQSNPNIPADQLSAIEDRMRSPGQQYMGYASALFAPVLILLIQAVIFHFTMVFLDGKNTFKQVFSVVSYSSLIGMLWGVIFVVLVLIDGRADITASLNFLVSDPDSTMFLILTKIDLFQIWQLIRMSIGLGIVSQTNFEKAASIVFGWWVFWCAISIGFQMAIGRLMNLG